MLLDWKEVLVALSCENLNRLLMNLWKTRKLSILWIEARESRIILLLSLQEIFCHIFLVLAPSQVGA